MKLTFKEKRQVVKIGFELAHILKNVPLELQGLAFNNLKTKYAEEILKGNFNLTLYEKFFIDKNIDYYRENLTQ